MAAFPCHHAHALTAQRPSSVSGLPEPPRFPGRAVWARRTCRAAFSRGLCGPRVSRGIVSGGVAALLRSSERRAHEPQSSSFCAGDRASLFSRLRVYPCLLPTLLPSAEQTAPIHAESGRGLGAGGFPAAAACPAAGWRRVLWEGRFAGRRVTGGAGMRARPGSDCLGGDVGGRSASSPQLWWPREPVPLLPVLFY